MEGLGPITPQSLAVDGDGNQHLVYWGCGGVCYTRTVTPAGQFEPAVRLATEARPAALRVGLPQATAWGGYRENPKIVVDPTPTATGPRRLAAIWKVAVSATRNRLVVMTGTTSAAGPTVSSGPTNLIAGVDLFFPPETLFSIAMNALGEAVVLFNFRPTLLPWLTSTNVFTVRNSGEIGWESGSVSSRLLTPKLLKLVSYPGRPAMGFLAVFPTSTGEFETVVGRTRDVIEGIVSYGNHKIRSARVDLMDGTGADPALPSSLPHLVAGSLTNASEATDETGHYAFVLSPGQSLPAKLKVRVTFDIMDAEKRPGRYTTITTHGSSGAPYMAQRVITTTAPVDFDFALSGASATEATCPIASTLSLAAGSVGSTNLQNPLRLCTMGYAFLSLVDALVVAPTVLPIVPSQLPLRVHLMEPSSAFTLDQGEGGDADFSATYCGWPPDQLRVRVGDSYFLPDGEDLRLLDNTVLHEVSHYYLQMMAGGCIPDRLVDRANPEQGPHRGYFNPSTTDSWEEGFAMFLGQLIRDTIPRLPQTSGVFPASDGVAWNGREWPMPGEYAHPKLKIREDKRVFQLLYKLTTCGALCAARSPESRTLPNFSLLPSQLFSYWTAPNRPSRNRPEHASFTIPADMLAVYQQTVDMITSLSSTFTPQHRSALDELFKLHGFFADLQRDFAVWQPGEEIGRAADNNERANPSWPNRRMPAPLKGSDILVSGVDATGAPAAVDAIEVEFRYDPPYADWNYAVSNRVLRPGRFAVELPNPSYGARALITAKRSSGSPVRSVPLVLSSAEFWDAMAALPDGADAFRSQTFVYKQPSGAVVPDQTPIASTILGPSAGGALVELSASFGLPLNAPCPQATWSGRCQAGACTKTYSFGVHKDRHYYFSTCSAGNPTWNVSGACTCTGLTSYYCWAGRTQYCGCTATDYGEAQLSVTAQEGQYTSWQFGFGGACLAVGPDPTLTYSWSAPNVSFDQPMARVTRGVFPPGDHAVSVYACNGTGVCAQSQLTISAPQLADSTPPSLTCPGPSRQDGVDATGAPVSFAIPVATDDQDPSPAVGCDRVSGTVFPYGRTPVTCTATDASDNASQCSFEVEVVDLPPTLVLSGPAALSLECGDAFSEPGYAASDVRDGDLTSRVVVTHAIDVHRPGSYTVTYAVTDQSGGAAQATRSVSVVDTTPPALSVSASPDVLWPPNHQLVPISVAVTAFDRCDPGPAVELVSVTSNEPVNSTGDGNTNLDIVAAMGTAATSVQLRSERKGNGSSRIYTLTYRARDASANGVDASAQVLVPHAQGR